MLTDKEKQIVLERAKTYPKGIDPEYWGFGPLTKSDVNGYPALPIDYDKDTLRQYG